MGGHHRISMGASRTCPQQPKRTDNSSTHQLPGVRNESRRDPYIHKVPPVQNNGQTRKCMARMYVLDIHVEIPVRFCFPPSFRVLPHDHRRFIAQHCPQPGLSRDKQTRDTNVQRARKCVSLEAKTTASASKTVDKCICTYVCLTNYIHEL